MRKLQSWYMARERCQCAAVGQATAASCDPEPVLREPRPGAPHYDGMPYLLPHGLRLGCSSPWKSAQCLKWSVCSLVTYPR
jgi:hypothetical protein